MEETQERQTHEGNPVYKVPEGNMLQLTDRVIKLNRRAAKLGMPPLVLTEVGSEYTTVTRTVPPDPFEFGDIENGYGIRKVTIKLVHVTLTGIAPRVNGWAMAATIQHEEGGNLLRTVPGFERLLPLQYRTAGTGCEHCGTERARKDTYVLQHADGAWKQVGRNCLADFLRSSDASGLAEWAEILAGLDDEVREYEEFGELWSGTRGYLSTLAFLAQAANVVRVDGWCSRSEAKNTWGKVATADTAASLFDSKVRNSLSAADQAKLEPTPADARKAEQAIAWAQGLAADVQNDYLWNVRTLAHKEHLGHRDLGIAVSIIQAFSRETEREISRKYAAERKPSEWFGVVGERAVYALTVTSLRPLENDFGPLTLVSFRDADGNVAKWFASGSPELEADRTYTFKATVKAHNTWTRDIREERGASDAKQISTKETLLTRVAVYDEQAEAEKKAAAKEAAKQARAAKKAASVEQAVAA